MEIRALIPSCGNVKRYRGRQAYDDRLKSVDEVSDNSENIALLQGSRPNVEMIDVITKVEPNSSGRLSTNVLKRFRDAYIDTMFYFAEQVAPLNKIGDIHFLKKIQDDAKHNCV